MAARYIYTIRSNENSLKDKGNVFHTIGRYRYREVVEDSAFKVFSELHSLSFYASVGAKKKNK